MDFRLTHLEMGPNFKAILQATGNPHKNVKIEITDHNWQYQITTHGSFEIFEAKNLPNFKETQKSFLQFYERFHH